MIMTMIYTNISLILKNGAKYLTTIPNLSDDGIEHQTIDIKVTAR